MNCEHKNKAYSNLVITQTCYPAINIVNWICKDCGLEGQTKEQEAINNEYEETKRKFSNIKGTGHITPITN